MRVTCLDSDLFSQGASWNLKSRDQADLELRAQWARLVLGGRAGIKQSLSFLPNMKIKTALSLVIGPGQLTVSAFQPLRAAYPAPRASGGAQAGKAGVGSRGCPQGAVSVCVYVCISPF